MLKMYKKRRKMLSLFHFLVRLGHLVTAVHQKDLLTYFVISKRFATDTSPSFFLFIFIFCVYIAWSLLREFRYLPREPGNISSFFMVFCFIVWRSRLVNDPLCTDRIGYAVYLVANACLWICEIFTAFLSFLFYSVGDTIADIELVWRLL